MPNREILREDWSGFFDRFSREHAGMMADMDLETRKGARRALAKDKVFIALELQGGRGEPAVAIIFQEAPGQQTVHIIKSIASVRHQQEGVEREEGVRVETADGLGTVVRIPAVSKPVTGRSAWNASVRRLLRS